MPRLALLLLLAFLVTSGAVSAAPPSRRPIPARRLGAPAAETGQLVDGPGGKLYVESLGPREGVPLVVVNGGPGLDHLYLHCSPVWDSLARTRPVVFYDQRGVGRSSRIPFAGRVTSADQVADLEAVRRHLGVERMDLLGHSYGGFLAMDYTTRNPNHVAHLILCDSAAPQWSATTNILWQIYPDQATVLDSVAYPSPDTAAYNAYFRSFMAMMFHQPQKRAEFMSHPEWLATYPQVNVSLREDMKDQDLRGAMMQLGIQGGVPTLLLTGRYDYDVAPQVAWQLHNDMRGSRFHVFENSGHLPFYEDPAEFLQVLSAFLARP